MENENSISLGGTIILLALFAQKNFFGQIQEKNMVVNLSVRCQGTLHLSIEKNSLSALNVFLCTKKVLKNRE